MNFCSFEPGGKCPCYGHRKDHDRWYCICSCPSSCHEYCHKGGTYQEREKRKKENKILEAERKERKFQEWLIEVNKNGGMIRCYDDWNKSFY